MGEVFDYFYEKDKEEYHKECAGDGDILLYGNNLGLLLGSVSCEKEEEERDCKSCHLYDPEARFPGSHEATSCCDEDDDEEGGGGLSGNYLETGVVDDETRKRRFGEGSTAEGPVEVRFAT